MIDITEKALDEVKNYFSKEEWIRPVRIFLMQGCVKALALALDELRETDDVFVFDNHTFVIDKELHEAVKDIKIDYIDTGFKLIYDAPWRTDCGGCSCS